MPNDAELNIRILAELETLKALGKEFSELSKEGQKFNQVLKEDLAKQSEALNSGFAKLQNSGGGLTKVLSKVGAVITLVGAGTAGAIVALKQFFDITAGVTFEVAKLGDELIKASKKTG